MNEKYTHGLWGAVAGAVALGIVGFSWGGWSTAGGTAKQVQSAVEIALIPVCVKDVMADPAAVAELKVKQAYNYDDVVRDYHKRSGNPINFGFKFNRDCGKAIEAVMAQSAIKS